MNQILLVALGSAVGGVLRYCFSISVHFFLGRSFPYGTLAVNVFGSFLMGLFFVILLEHFANIAQHLRALLLIGLLGSFTTFSAFSLETISLFEQGEVWRAGLNIMLSLGLCLFAVSLGVLFGKQL